MFLVLAFFAAKIFGGTLFPKTPRVDFPAVTVGGHAYFLSVTREEGKTPAFSLRQIDATDSGNSVLVAPISLGANVTVGAGSTLTKDVPAGALALGRAKQLVKEHWQPPSAG